MLRHMEVVAINGESTERVFKRLMEWENGLLCIWRKRAFDSPLRMLEAKAD